jgi:hypothetical protein
MTHLVPYVGAERKRERPKRATVSEEAKPDDFYICAMKDVCKKHDVTLERVQSKSFHPKLLLARRECVTMLRDNHGLTWRRIGMLMRRDRKACSCLWGRVHGEG